MAQASRGRRLDPRRAKIHRSYTIAEAAVLFGVHRNTVRNWIRNGLETVRLGRQVLILGDVLRAHLAKRRSERRIKCPPGAMYCLKCRNPQRPPDGLVEAIQTATTTLNLRGLCPTCGSLMHRRANPAQLVEIGFGCVLPTQPHRHLVDKPDPSPNCHPLWAA
jgi:excisionase family DNA binding protein